MLVVPPVDPEFIYKIISPPSLFNPRNKILPLSPLDKADGFYHLSTVTQVPLTANRYFPPEKYPQLLILKLYFPGVNSQVKWEPPKDEDPQTALASGRIFPHVYGELDQDHIVGRILLKQKPNGDEWNFDAGWENDIEPE